MPAAIVCVAAMLYGWHLHRAPVNLGGDEAQFLTNAYSLATTGRDVSGRTLPLFINLAEPSAGLQSSVIWYQPVLFYLTAAELLVVPLTEVSVRVVTVLIGLVNLALMYAIARRLFGTRGFAVIAIFMLALSPAHAIFSRIGLDYIAPVPFVLGWLWLFLVSLERDRKAIACATGVVLGVGCYSYVAAWALMPMLLVISWYIWWREKRVAPVFASGLGFLLPMLPLLVWLATHPETFSATLSRYHPYDTTHLSLLKGVKDMLTYNNLQERVSVYWDYFNPTFLFLVGGTNMTASTRNAGVFLWPIAPLFVAGLGEVWARRRAAIGTVLLAGLALAPLPAALLNERYAIQRALLLLPFIALISTFGVVALWQQRRQVIRAGVVVVFVLAALQFATFYRDYLTEYQLRSAIWFDPVDFRDVANYLIAADSSGTVPAVYLSEDLDDAKPRWRFYLDLQHRETLLGKTRYFHASSLDVRAVPPGSLLVVYAGDPVLPAWLEGGHIAVAKRIVDVAGSKTAVILTRVAAR